MTNIPGLNLLRLAQTVIRKQSITYYKFVSRSPNSAGVDVSTFESPKALKASVQPVERSAYDRLGLDYTKRYIRIWIDVDIEPLFRDRASDELDFNGRRYALKNDEDWVSQDGWNYALAVDIGAAT